MPSILLSVNQNRIAINRASIRRSAKKILSALGCTESELSISLVDDEEMARLNSEYRGIEATTDVLSFPMHEGEFDAIAPEMLGDVVISAPTAQEMADLHGCSLQTILDLLLVHGTLHLLGLDHEEGPDAARLMHRKTLELLKMLGHADDDFEWYRSESPDRSAPES
ncbi:MAG: rRNA maturation RNase YbeY [Syntrophobacteraceae bacterium]